MNTKLVYIMWFASFFVLQACITDTDKKVNTGKEELVNEVETVGFPDSVHLGKELVENIDAFKSEDVVSKLEQVLIASGLVDIQSVDSSLRVDVKYATEDNFMNEVLYPDFHKVYLQPEVAERLSLAQKALQKIDSSLSLLVFDGARPRSVQSRMWNAMDTLPVKERVKFVSNPANGSLHNYGCAVDLTIVNIQTDKWLDMGAGYDDLRKIAYPRHESKFLSSGELSKAQLENRKLLREVMRAGGFWVIETEWWHFNAFTREKAKQRYEIVE